MDGHTHKNLWEAHTDLVGLFERRCKVWWVGTWSYTWNKLEEKDTFDQNAFYGILKEII